MGESVSTSEFSLFTDSPDSDSPLKEIEDDISFSDSIIGHSDICA